jgi:hypothetical protein
MFVTKDDIQAFNRFVDEKLAGGGAESLRQLVAEWDERQQVDAAIRQGIDAGRAEPFFESQDRFRQERAN